MDSEICNIEAAESERLLSGNVVKPHIYGSKEPGPHTAIMADSEARIYPSETRPQYIAALAATGGALAMGAALAWSSPTQTQLVITPENPDNEYHFKITDADFSWIGSLVTLGAASVCLIIGTILQILGRKLTMLLLVIPFTIGWLLVIFATNLTMLLVGRFLLGVAGGAFCVAAPTYTGEIAQPSIRGTLGSYFQLMMVIGILIVYGIGSYVTVFVLNVISAMIPLIFGAIFVFMPESPTYLVAKGKKEEAAKSLKWLRGSRYDFSQELAELQQQHEDDQNNKISLFAALKRRATVKALFISLGLMFFQQMSGVNAVIFFTKNIFESAGTGIDSGVATIVVGCMQVISVFVSSVIVDKAGRRLLLLPSALVMAITTALLGTYFFMKEKNPDSVTSLSWLPIASLCGFIILFSIGFGPIPWMMMGELFSNDIKGIAGSVAGAFNWTLAFVITSTFDTLNKSLGKGETFWLFAGFCVVGLLFVFFFVPETKGKSLPEIQQILAGEKVMSSKNASERATSDSKF